MRTRRQFLCFLPLIVAALTMPNPASAEIVLQAVGTQQGTILGASTVPGHTNWIDVYSFQHGVSVGLGPGGLPTGPPSLSDVTLTKLFDRASINLLTAIANQEVLTNVTIEFVTPPATVAYYRVALTNARLSGYSQSSGGDHPSESASLSYSTITLTDVAQGTSVSYTRYGGSTAIVVPGQFEKGFLLPPAPNPSHGDTQFRFSLPSGCNAELTLFDTQGRRVREVHNGWTAAEPVVTTWDGTDDRGTKVAPGMYLARLTYPGTVVTQRFAVVR